MCGACYHVDEVSDFEILATPDRGMPARELKIERSGVCGLRRDAVPTLTALFDDDFVENCAVIAVEYSSLTGRLLTC